MGPGRIVLNLKVEVRVRQKLEIGRDFLEAELTKIRVASQRLEVATTPRLKTDQGIDASFAPGHTHDLQQGLPVKGIVQLVLINKKQIRNEGQIELTVAKGQMRQL